MKRATNPAGSSLGIALAGGGARAGLIHVRPGQELSVERTDAVEADLEQRRRGDLAVANTPLGFASAETGQEPCVI